MVPLHKDIDAAVRRERWNTATARNSIYNLRSVVAYFHTVRTIGQGYSKRYDDIKIISANKRIVHALIKHRSYLFNAVQSRLSPVREKWIPNTSKNLFDSRNIVHKSEITSSGLIFAL